MIIQPNSIVYDGDNNDYKVLEPLGNGAFGYVYKVEKQFDNSIWALKTLPSNFPSHEQLLGFQNESNMAMNVDHENATRYIYVHNGSTYPQLPPYILMDYANEGTLYKLINNAIEKNEFISNADLYYFYHQLIDGMEAINSILIHRDIKPDNILINDGQIKITDFGLSKIVHDGTRQLTFKGFGHIKYMAPEGWKKETNTIQMDIYSMGITFYELATLRHPYPLKDDANFLDWEKAHYFTNAASPTTINKSINSTIAQGVLRMMEKSTSKRYKTWDEIRRDLTIQTPNTENTAIIESMVNMRISKDSAIREEQLKKQKEQEEKMTYVRTVNYQFENDVLQPLNEFIDEFNLMYTEGKIRLETTGFMKSGEIIANIRLVSGKELRITLMIIHDEDFYRDVPVHFQIPGGRTHFKQLVRPQLKNQKVLAWGHLKNRDDKTGFNIVLVENNEDIYGQWFILRNTNSGFGRTPRMEPFPFELEEIEREIQLITATHIYNTEVLNLDMDLFKEFIMRLN